MNPKDGGIDLHMSTLKIEGDPATLYQKLAEAQAEFLPVPEEAKGQVGNNRSFKYADFATIIKCVRPALTRHGIAFLQPLHTDGEMAVTTTILAGHGASITASLMFPHNEDCQKFGQAHTYHRRYQLLGFFAIEGEDADEARKEGEKIQRGFTEKKSEPRNEAPKASSTNSSTKSEPESKAATSPTAPSASSGESSSKVSQSDPANNRPINDILRDGMRKLGWNFSNLKEFYKEHIDPAGFDKADNLNIDQKRALLKKMVELKGIEPF
jgi:hypothetical protein